MTAQSRFSKKFKKTSPRSKLLRETMARHGFILFPYEWWHFDFQGWEEHPPLDVGLEEQGGSRRGKGIE